MRGGGQQLDHRGRNTVCRVSGEEQFIPRVLPTTEQNSILERKGAPDDRSDQGVADGVGPSLCNVFTVSPECTKQF